MHMNDIELNQIVLAFLLTLFAGLATGIGSAIACFSTRTNTKFLSASLGFSAGVMIYVSFVDILVKAQDSLVSHHGEVVGSWLTVGAFFAGILLIALIDNFIPEAENPHEVKSIEDMSDAKNNKDKKLMRMGVFTALAIAIHNFPEGLATFMASLSDPHLGITIAIAIAIAIAIHNIPEGIAASVPIYHATDNKKKAFTFGLLSGLAEPIGALVGYMLLLPFLNDTTFGIIFALVAGIMVFISLDELLPAAQKYGEHHLSIYSLIAGMAVMALSLLLFL